MAKSALPASRVREAVEARLGAVSDFEPLPEGLVSQVFAFRRGDDALVVRVGGPRASYEKDAFVARTFARPGLPIPDVLAIDDLADGLVFCVSRRARGAPVSGLDADVANDLAPAVLESLAEIGRADAAAVTGYGRFDASGRAGWRSWRDYLLRYHGDADAWTAHLSDADAMLLRHALARVDALAPADEPARRLIHGDFGTGNVIADGAVVSAVIDWNFAAIGDARYEVANLLFWNEARLAAVCETIRRRDAEHARTLACYQLRIAVEEVRRTITGGVGGADLDWLLARVRALLDEAAAHDPAKQPSPPLFGLG